VGQALTKPEALFPISIPLRHAKMNFGHVEGMTKVDGDLSFFIALFITLSSREKTTLSSLGASTPLNGSDI
jgi:hypothetical protein